MFVPEKIDIILGDVNINALDDETFPPPKNILNSYEMVVRKPNHLDRWLLDHVYIHTQSVFKKMEFQVVVSILQQNRISV